MLCAARSQPKVGNEQPISILPHKVLEQHKFLLYFPKLSNIFDQKKNKEHSLASGAIGKIIVVPSTKVCCSDHVHWDGDRSRQCGEARYGTNYILWSSDSGTVLEFFFSIGFTRLSCRLTSWHRERWRSPLLSRFFTVFIILTVAVSCTRNKLFCTNYQASCLPRTFLGLWEPLFSVTFLSISTWGLRMSSNCTLDTL